MTTTTDDPVVAFVYGLLGYPSQRPAADTAAALIGGQPGPWSLPNPDQAAQARELVARFHTAAPARSPLGVTAEALEVSIADRLFQSCLMSSALLGEFWESHRGGLIPAPLDHDVDVMQQRLTEFAGRLATWMASRTDAPVQAGLPDPAEASRWRVDEWIVFLREHRIPQKDALAAVRKMAEDAERTPPANLRDMAGRLDLAELMLGYVDARPAAEEALRG